MEKGIKIKEVDEKERVLEWYICISYYIKIKEKRNVTSFKTHTSGTNLSFENFPFFLFAFLF